MKLSGLKLRHSSRMILKPLHIPAALDLAVVHRLPKVSARCYGLHTLADVLHWIRKAVSFIFR